MCRTIPWPAHVIARLPRSAVRPFADEIVKVQGYTTKSRCFDNPRKDRLHPWSIFRLSSKQRLVNKPYSICGIYSTSVGLNLQENFGSTTSGKIFLISLYPSSIFLDEYYASAVNRSFGNCSVNVIIGAITGSDSVFYLDKVKIRIFTFYRKRKVIARVL